MSKYFVQLLYFRATGRYVTSGRFSTELIKLNDIWEEVHELRRMGQLPGLAPNSGRDLLILVDVMEHPRHEPYIAIPARIDEEDVTPVRVPTREMLPLVRMPLQEMPRESRTRTRQISRDDEITPVDGRVLKMDGDDEDSE